MGAHRAGLSHPSGIPIAMLGAVEVGDRQPGKSPRIQSGPDTMTFILRIDSYDGQLIELIVTCHRTGEMYAALRHAKDTDAR